MPCRVVWQSWSTVGPGVQMAEFPCLWSLAGTSRGCRTGRASWGMAVTFKVTVVISSSAGPEGGLCNDTLADLIFTNLRVFTGKDSEFDRGQVTYQRPHRR